MEEDECDYFTKLYVMEKEYRLEVHALSVVKAEEAIPQQVVYQELPVRTESYGWAWQEIDSALIPADWVSMAIRAVYVTGHASGTVKIGELANGTAIIVDLNPPATSIAVPAVAPPQPFTMGADIEFMLSCDDDLLPASTFFPLEGPIGCDARQIEQDSGEYALAEIRPQQAESPHDLFRNIMQLLQEAFERVPYDNVQFRAGSMPFPGYQCGGHIHFGIPLSLSLLRALDQYLALPMALIEEPRTAKRRRQTKHGGLGRYREKPYGFEYLTLSSWILEPELALAVLCLAHLVASHHHELPCDLLFHPLVQRAYYQGNQVFLRQCWATLKKQLIRTASYPRYERELTQLFNRIEQGGSLPESHDIRRRWGGTVGKTSYEPGMIIQIPKKTRLKFHLLEGQTAQVRAGKSMVPAIIRSYPYSFYRSNVVQLSRSLRSQLSLPKEWSPKVSCANGILTLGPIIGILACRPYEKQTAYFQLLCRMAKERQMLVYIFEPQDIDWEKRLIRGTSLYGDAFFPFPAVVYDRYLSPGSHNSEVNETRYKLQYVYDIPFINSLALFSLTGNKWETYQVLSANHQEYLPDTRLLKTPADIAEMLDRYGEIFIKPLDGALSKGVLRVIRRSTGLFWMDAEQPDFQPVASMQELVAMLDRYQGPRGFLVQEGIRRKAIDNHLLEMRVYMHKNGKKKWLRTGMLARLTPGVMKEETEIDMRLSLALAKLYPDEADRRRIREQLAAVARSVVLAVEERVGAFGELAVDFTIDQYDALKILEINSKPANLFMYADAYRLRLVSCQRLLHYAAALAGYENDEN
ncbi:YheC/YheD family protein [Brevibacillus sp. SYP-B805]|uniref:putative amidoligase domain-containing protein n=1 Tax=Brevibacillus sp. SYP-B805 TaxID=1578199 RepID=UPI001F49D8CB|nr:YheC/YheD family protein [Brevibacillus sp. SYP-B805]